MYQRAFGNAHTKVEFPISSTPANIVTQVKRPLKLFSGVGWCVCMDAGVTQCL
jgi:hypothetical protein